MSVENQIDRINQAKLDLRTAIQNQGVTVPDDAKIDTYSAYVNGISTVRSVSGVLPDDGGNVPLTIENLDGLSDIKVVSTSTAESGTPASVEVVKSGSVANLSFIIPKGDDGINGTNGKDGVAASIQVGTVTTGAAGTNASVTNVGTPNAAKLNFTIPRGEVGAKGNDGYTPKKGTDYWTETDRQSIVSEVLNNTSHRYVTKTISLTSWQTVSENVFTSSFTDTKIPADCKLDIALNTADLLRLMDDGVGSIRADNDNGTVQIVCIGAKPTAELTAQISFVNLVQA